MSVFSINQSTHQVIVEEGEVGYGEVPIQYVPKTPLDPLSPRTWVGEPEKI